MLNDALVATRDEGNKTIMDVATENVDFRNAEQLKAALGSLVQSGKIDLIMNLQSVNFMDSSGLSVLLTGKRITEEAGGTFIVCGLQGYVNNLINLTNLDKVIEIHPTVASAAS